MRPKRTSKSMKNGPLGALMSIFIVLGRFWNEAKKTLFFETSLMGPKIRKIGARSGLEAALP